MNMLTLSLWREYAALFKTMGIVERFDISRYCEMVGAKVQHPLVGVVDLGKLPPVLFNQPPHMFDYYAIYLKGRKYTELHYGNSLYDYSEGALVFFAPGRVAGSESDGLRHKVQGQVLMFHPDLLSGTSLQAAMSRYSYFSYDIRDALFPTAREKSLLVDIFGKIENELLTASPDMTIVIDYIQLVLDYCLHSYDRQFAVSQTASNDILARFERLCDEYYESGQPKDNGPLTVQYCADRLCFSVNYLSDLIRECTGQSPQKHIQRKTLARAELLLLTTSLRINEIASELGFQQPQNFSKWFKRLEGCSPEEYRKRR